MILLPIRRYRTMMFVIAVSFYLGYLAAFVSIRQQCVDFFAIFENGQTESLYQHKYAVLVISGPFNEAKRDAVRATWSKFSNNMYTENGELLYKWNHTYTLVGQQSQEDNIVKIFFAIGTKGLNASTLTKLKTERSRGNDLLLLDSYEDSYRNLATKVLHSLKWINSNMRHLKYLIKCDDDSFVRVDLIIKELEAYAPNMDDPALSKYISYKNNLPSYKGLYWGYFNGRARVYLSGKWEETDWFLCDNYLPYALGGGYVISHSIVDYIDKNADFMSLYNSEDVSMGVWTAPLGGINRVHDIRFDTEWKSRGCSKQMLVRHKQSPSDMFHLYTTLVHTNGEKLCETELLQRKSYMYEWNVLPSSCCK